MRHLYEGRIVKSIEEKNKLNTYIMLAMSGHRSSHDTLLLFVSFTPDSGIHFVTNTAIKVVPAFLLDFSALLVVLAVMFP